MDNTVLYDLSYGMYAVGVKDGMRECGCIVNTVFQVSTIGPLIALSMNSWSRASKPLFSRVLRLFPFRIAF